MKTEYKKLLDDVLLIKQMLEKLNRNNIQQNSDIEKLNILLDDIIPNLENKINCKIKGGE